jgi:hypothetical protein
MIELYSQVTASGPGFGGVFVDLGASVIGGGAGSYECEKNDMKQTVDGFGEVRFTRVDKILEPDPVYLN